MRRTMMVKPNVNETNDGELNNSKGNEYCRKVSVRYGHRIWQKYDKKLRFDIIVNKMEDIR